MLLKLPAHLQKVLVLSRHDLQLIFYQQILERIHIPRGAGGLMRLGKYRELLHSIGAIAEPMYPL